MTKRIKVAILSMIMVVGVAGITIENDKLFEISKNLEIFISVYKELNTNFADELDPSTLMRTAIDAMTHSLDPYTNFVSESQVESYWINEDDKYQGIGARVGLVQKKLMILEAYQGGPALTAGIKSGDEIISVNGVNIEGKKIEEVNAILRGIPGTDIKLSIKKNGSDLAEDINVKRGEVNIPNVPYSGFVADGVGYISLTTFTQNAGSNISKALRELKTKNPNMSGIILDLRQNGGGLLHEAVNICNIFIPNGEIVVTTKSKVKERDQTFKTLSQPADLEIPLAILIDKRSASASEIVSGVMQDLDRAVLIGQRSFGKGLVQNTKELPYNARLKITTSKYYIPSGRCIQGVEYENGEPKDIPDSQRTKFKTKNGRIVMDGGGVTPDVKLPARNVSAVTQALVDQHIIFDYVNNFCQNKEKIDTIGVFKFTDFTGFTEYLKKRNFQYETEVEKYLNKAKESMDSASDKTLSDEIVKLKQKISASKSDELQASKMQIIEEIEKEIVSRYYFQKGKVQLTLDNDPEVKEAISILKDSNRYKKILAIK
ncbi:MAG TPA: S41 family peptidase [Saprospiraceae bacterium]|jgi:carboxyl-terminal processing protease|nr:S41 family peptidase [Saprospiraceae bacterium]HMT69146.1 S41 family peptidase [Saprospiraceae bacterium]